MSVFLPLLVVRARVEIWRALSHSVAIKHEKARQTPPRLPGLCRGGDRALRASLLLLAIPLIGAPGCAANSYMGISLARGPADAAPESGAASASLPGVAARARAGDKQAQLDLGMRFEEGRGVPRDLRRAQALYGAAAKDSGGTRMMFVPQRNGSVSAVLVNSGSLVAGLPEARAALVRLAEEKREPTASPAPEGPAFPVLRSGRRPSDAASEGRESIFHGSVGSVFLTIVKFELFSEKCLVRGREYGEERSIYAEKAWKCLLTSQLPSDCAAYPNAILRSVRFVRFHPNFVTLQKSMPRVIEQCLAAYRGTASSAYDEVNYAGVLDLALDGLKHSTPRQKALVDRFKQSDAAHSYVPPLPGYIFSEQMCGNLVAGEEIEQPGFWFLFCDNINDGYSPRADRSEAIDKIMRERNLDAGAN